MAAHPGRRRRHRRRDAAGGRGAARGRRSGHRRRGARPRVQERPHAAAPGARHRDPAGGPGGCRVDPRIGDARRREPRPRARRTVRPGRPPDAADRCTAIDRGRRHAGRARGGEPRPPVAGARRCPGRPRHRRGRAGDPGPQSPRDRVGRAVPRLRPRPGLPGLRASARLPPGRHDVALPPLRSGDAARHAMPELSLAADPLPRWWHGTGRARGPRSAPDAASGPPRSRRRRPSRGARSASSTRSPPDGPTCWWARASWRRASTCRRSRWSAWSRRTWRSTSPTSVPRSGRTSSCARPSAGPAVASDPAARSCRPTSRTTRSSAPSRPRTATRSTRRSWSSGGGSGHRRTGR